MATRGVVQCQRLILSYCEHGGSSRAVRDYLQSNGIVRWAKDRPSVQVHVRVRNGKHPNVRAEYLTSPTTGRRDGAVVQHQVCIKNRPSVESVESALDQLYNRSGRKMTKFTRPVYTQTPSVQGVWTPSLDLHLRPDFGVTIVE
jgi:large subunit ribosomal protein L43